MFQTQMALGIASACLVSSLAAQTTGWSSLSMSKKCHPVLDGISWTNVCIFTDPWGISIGNKKLLFGPKFAKGCVASLKKTQKSTQRGGICLFLGRFQKRCAIEWLMLVGSIISIGKYKQKSRSRRNIFRSCGKCKANPTNQPRGRELLKINDKNIRD